MEAFEQVYREYFRDVELYLLAICHDEHLAAELGSQVFFTALEQYPKFRGAGHVRTWLCAIGRNLYFSHLRKAGKELPLEESLIDSGISIEERMEDREEAMRIHKVLHSLPEPYKEVFPCGCSGSSPSPRLGRYSEKRQTGPA